MTLSALDLLASVEAAFFSAHPGALYGLAIHHARAGLRNSAQANPKAFAECTVDPLPGAVDTPFPEVPVNGGPSRKVVGKQAPLASGFQEVEDGVEDLAKIVGPGPPESFGSWHVGFYVVPFGVG
jgi:hypothetical protein